MSLASFSKFLFPACFVVFVCCATTRIATDDKPLRIAFYNVENLFDTKDDADVKDEEFTPGSEKCTRRSATGKSSTASGR